MSRASKRACKAAKKAVPGTGSPASASRSAVVSAAIISCPLLQGSIAVSHSVCQLSAMFRRFGNASSTPTRTILEKAPKCNGDVLSAFVTSNGARAHHSLAAGGPGLRKVLEKLATIPRRWLALAAELRAKVARMQEKLDELRSQSAGGSAGPAAVGAAERLTQAIAVVQGKANALVEASVSGIFADDKDAMVQRVQLACALADEELFYERFFASGFLFQEREAELNACRQLVAELVESGATVSAHSVKAHVHVLEQAVDALTLTASLELSPAARSSPLDQVGAAVAGHEFHTTHAAVVVSANGSRPTVLEWGASSKKFGPNLVHPQKRTSEDDASVSFEYASAATDVQALLCAMPDPAEMDGDARPVLERLIRVFVARVSKPSRNMLMEVARKCVDFNCEGNYDVVFQHCHVFAVSVLAAVAGAAHTLPGGPEWESLLEHVVGLAEKAEEEQHTLKLKYRGVSFLFRSAAELETCMLLASWDTLAPWCQFVLCVCSDTMKVWAVRPVGVPEEEWDGALFTRTDEQLAAWQRRWESARAVCGIAWAAGDGTGADARSGAGARAGGGAAGGAAHARGDSSGANA